MLRHNNQFLYSGDYARFQQKSVLKTPSAFMASCKLMELVVIGNTVVVNNKTRNATAPDGTIYTERRLSLSVEFMGGLFMKIEQKVEYTGNSVKSVRYFLFKFRKHF